MNRWVLVGLLAGAAVLFFMVVRIFLVPLVVAATFVALLYPLYQWMLERLWKNRALASLSCCALLTLCVVVPLFLVFRMMTLQALEFGGSAGPQIRMLVQKLHDGAHALPYAQTVLDSGFDWQSSLMDAAKSATSAAAHFVNKASTGFLTLVLNLAAILFVMFYLFMDGGGLVKRLRYLSPLRAEYEETILSRFLMISRAVIKGTLFIGLLQGTLGAIVLLIFGVKSWLLWGVAMIVLSIIPLAGAWTVLIPAGLIQLALGHTVQGIGILACSLLVVSQIDNFIRPRLVGQEAKVHDLIVFFSSIGGIAMFGPLGFIVGPVIASFFVAVLDIYGKEFERQLTSELPA
jgi:predicted PurR-regulated permease PerM